MLIGITGGIGSGKSTLARMLAERGAGLVDADLVGHRALELPALAAALVAEFGSQIADEKGQVQRRELGKLAFASAESFAKLTRTVRPYLEPMLWGEVNQLQAQPGGGVVIVDAALIYEWGVANRFDLVVVVDAPEGIRCRRAAARQGLSEAEVLRRMAWQLAPAEKRARADVVVENTGSLEELARRAEEIWQQLQDTPRRKQGSSES